MKSSKIARLIIDQNRRVKTGVPCWRDDKRIYRTAEGAYMQRNKLVYQLGVATERLNVYYCDWHEGWHLGNAPVTAQEAADAAKWSDPVS